MADRRANFGPLPAGWECKFDPRTGRYYYINHLKKLTTWEDPRLKVHHPPHETIPLQDLTNRPGSSAARSSPRLAYSRTSGASNGSALQETSMASSSSGSATVSADQSIAKITAMFPTVSEPVVKDLLKKYLKSVYPKAEETMLLDLLTNCDNNVQKASEKLSNMGYEKKDTPPPISAIRQKLMKSLEPEPKPPPKVRTDAEKKSTKNKLENRYKERIPVEIIKFALESTNFSEEQTCQILDMMIEKQEEAAKRDKEEKESTSPDKIIDSQSAPSKHTDKSKFESPTHHSSQSREKDSSRHRHDHKHSKKATPKVHRRAKGKRDVARISRGTSTHEDLEYKSTYRVKPVGSDITLHKGPSDDLLLSTYLPWSGPENELCRGPNRELARGPDHSLRQGRLNLANGPNRRLVKGPRGLAKGSIYQEGAGSVSL